MVPVAGKYPARVTEALDSLCGSLRMRDWLRHTAHILRTFFKK